MRSSARLVLVFFVVVALSAAYAGTSFAASANGRDSGHAVFVLTDNPSGNQVVAYDRAADGSLTQAGVYATGGTGGVLDGSVVDHTASQGALAYDASRGLLFAVNPGSSTVSVFRVLGDRLVLTQVVSSGGAFPVSIAARGGVVYVLNALNGGSVQGFLVAGGFVLALPGSGRPLGLNPSATPQFTTTPGQVAFSPDGSKLVVTTKGNSNAIDVFSSVGWAICRSRRSSTSNPARFRLPRASTAPGTLWSPRPGRTHSRRSLSTRTARFHLSSVFRPASRRRAGSPQPDLLLRIERRKRVGERLRIRARWIAFVAGQHVDRRRDGRRSGDS